MAHLKTIPVFDLNDFAKNKKKFTQEFGEAFHKYGFVRLKNHGIPEGALKEAEDVITRFFQLDEKAKKQYEMPEHSYQVGFIKNKEIANNAKAADLKEYFMVCRDARRGADKNTPETPDIAEVPEFRKKTYDLYYEFNTLISRILRPLALHIGEEESFFENIADKGHNMMRMIHYPSGGNAASHTDMSLLTLLRAEKAGLYVTTRDGEELEVVAEPGELILNGGKALAALTGNYFKPSYHRVNVKSKDPRQTIVYFAHLNNDYKLDTVAKLKNYDGGLEDEGWFKNLKEFPIRYKDYTQARLKHNFSATARANDNKEKSARNGKKPKFSK